MLASLSRKLFSRLGFYPPLPLEGGRDPLMPPTVEDAAAAARALSFPPGFEFGTATSSYQVEGGIAEHLFQIATNKGGGAVSVHSNIRRGSVQLRDQIAANTATAKRVLADAEAARAPVPESRKNLSLIHI